MYNYQKLFGKMRELDITQNALAKAIGVSEVTLNKKLQNKSEFKQSEMLKTLKALNEQGAGKIEEYFFTGQLVKTQDIEQ